MVSRRGRKHCESLSREVAIVGMTGLTITNLHCCRLTSYSLVKQGACKKVPSEFIITRVIIKYIHPYIMIASSSAITDITT